MDAGLTLNMSQTLSLRHVPATAVLQAIVGRYADLSGGGNRRVVTVDAAAETATVTTSKYAEQKKQPVLSLGWTHRIKAETVYYLVGPQQMSPPDGKLAAGTKVTVVEEGGSYVRVVSEGGVAGWVVREAVEKP
jgi:hypothetical protein